MPEKTEQNSSLGFLLGVALIIAAIIASRTYVSVKKMDDVITVSGSAKQQVTSDSARWTASFSRTVYKDQIKLGYSQMKADEKTVQDFFTAQGFKDAEISPVFMNEVWKNNADSPTQYNLVQNVSVRSTDVNKMKELAKNSDKLAAAGVLFSAGPVEYYFTKLPELRVSLLPDAIKDAKNRAGVIAGSSDKKIDSIKSVSMGVVQLMPVGTVDVSDYGSYDTSQIDKDVMLTVKAVFSLK